MEITLTADLDNLEEVAETILKSVLPERDVVCFYGTMGSGKTTLIAEICKQLGVTDTVSSPTFALINEYRTDCSDPVYHFDIYRIKQLAEVYDMGYEDYFYGQGICFIEWPELIEELLPEDTVCITIEELPDGSRMIRTR
ncbi:MAG: tRNA (adenosine(37)-N6)-threonylcarbamoyltransferase complex ATPase subunit type 1 TsaE [Rikenellaceae bacterium]|nr:tRNA (adenosine(37)-N6)-threonylcarbamoyltransferase complex ATPase subunit type 1 TsaE [Rikenellaceae bacterium]